MTLNDLLTTIDNRRILEYGRGRVLLVWLDTDPEPFVVGDFPMLPNSQQVTRYEWVPLGVI